MYITPFAITLLLTLGLFGCGQKGPLYLPDRPDAALSQEQ
ncbi:MAG: lipoprotein [Oleibacter sp.]|nr:lipoprotein [Thalassolituus sp.]